MFVLSKILHAKRAKCPLYKDPLRFIVNFLSRAGILSALGPPCANIRTLGTKNHTVTNLSRHRRTRGRARMRTARTITELAIIRTDIHRKTREN